MGFKGVLPHLQKKANLLAGGDVGGRGRAYSMFFLADPGEARGCSTNTSVINSVMVCESIFTAPPRPNDCRWCFQS